MISDSGLVKPVVRGINILELLSKQSLLTVDEIATRTKIPRTSVFRLLNTLEALKCVERENIKGMDRWGLGLELLVLSNSKLCQLDLTKKVRGIMEDLAERTDACVQLCVLYSGKVMYIDHVKRAKPLTMYAEVGTQLPINVCAPGMVLAAALGEKELDRLLKEEDFPKYTPNTPTDPNQLRGILKKVARQGFAIDDQQTAIGNRCIAAPILDYNNRVAAALNITGSLSTISDERIPTLVEQVKAAAEEASKRMGYIVSPDISYPKRAG